MHPNCEAKPQSRKPDAKEDGQGKQKPSFIVHPEQNPKPAHAYILALTAGRGDAQLCSFGQFHCHRCTKP
jgi:hypothetical protein